MDSTTTDRQAGIIAGYTTCSRQDEHMTVSFAVCTRDGKPLCELHGYLWEMDSLRAERARESVGAKCTDTTDAALEQAGKSKVPSAVEHLRKFFLAERELEAARG